MKRTKIIATLGPATDRPGVLKAILAAGVDLIRLNCSHGLLAEHEARLQAARAFAAELQKPLGVIADLQGPKIRIGCFQAGSIVLNPGDPFVIDAQMAADAGNNCGVGVDYPSLAADVQVGDTLILDDGLIVLLVQTIQESAVHTIVQLGGKLSNHKGLNRRGGGLSAESLTPKDRQDLIWAAARQVDYVALSFPRSACDLDQARALLVQHQSRAGLLAKIERVEAVQALDEIIIASDGVMVARGDLGIELGYAELPAVQKRIIARARALDRPVVTATQMMESMIHHCIPTRAEVSDVANAVLDGTDAVMLSGETAVGDFPTETVAMMQEICVAVEREKITQISQHRVECRFESPEEAIAMATMYSANHMNTRAIVCITETAALPLWMSRIRSGIPIYAFSRDALVCGRMTLYRGVYPMYVDQASSDEASVDHQKSWALQKLLDMKGVQPGDRIILVFKNTLEILIID